MHRRHPELLPNSVPLLAKVVAMNWHNLLTHLLNMEANWPLQKQQQQRLPTI